MNVKKGLFRVWVVCSAVLVVYIIHEEWKNVTYASTYYFNRQSLIEEERDLLKVQLNNFLETQKYYAKHRLGPMTEAQKLDDKMQIEGTQERLKDPQPLKPRMDWAYAAVIDPLILFIIGWLLWKIIEWAKSGFKRDINDALN